MNQPFNHDPDAKAGRSEGAMHCDTVWDLLSAYADGEADARETAVVEAHVAECTSCARDLAFMRGTSTLLADVAELEPPARLREAIFAATIYRPTLADRVAAAVRRAFAPAPARYGALIAAGAAAAFTLATLHQGTGNLVNPAEYRSAGPGAVADLPRHDTPRTLREDMGAVSEAIRRSAASAPEASAPGRPAAPRVAVVRSAGRSRTASASREHRMAAATAPRVTYRARPVPTVDPAAATPAIPAPVMADARSTEPEAASAGPAPMEAPVAPADATPSQPARIVLAASSHTMDAGQIASLADLRRTLSRRASDRDGGPITAAPDGREIRIDVIRGSF
ncbi:MAG: zf-HC2 domain-containing protein [Chthonomonadales bacterium]|nr:zf-HC2 domain-containing protein [Chthonomonadales bacterium]